VSLDAGQTFVHSACDQKGGFRRVRGCYRCCLCDREKRKFVLIALGDASFRVVAGRRVYRARDNRHDSGALRFPRLCLLRCDSGGVWQVVETALLHSCRRMNGESAVARRLAHAY
jgi:hypothetical protein